MTADQNEPYTHSAYELCMKMYGATPGWPKDVARLSFEGENALGFDENNNLYFAGKRLQYRQKIQLTAWQLVIASIAACGAIGTAAAQWTRIILGI